MTRISDAIREGTRLARMRLGQEVPEWFTVPSKTDVRVALVPLTEAETQQGVIAAASLEVVDNAAGLAARNRMALHHDLWRAMRDPQDPQQLAFDSPTEMTELLTPDDIDFFSDHLTTLMDYASPSVDGLSEKDLDDLKKAFAEIDLNVLTGRQWAAVKLCFQALLPELLQAKLFGSISTESLTGTNESDESISAASLS